MLTKRSALMCLLREESDFTLESQELAHRLCVLEDMNSRKERRKEGIMEGKLKGKSPKEQK